VRPPLWLRARQFASDHANKIWLAIIVLGLVAALAGIRNEGDVRRAEMCEFARNGQRADRLLIDTVLEPGPGIPLLDVESFASLPAAVQTYLRDLAIASTPTPDPDGDSLAERLQAHRDEQLGPEALPSYC
jgi:hypothetical protein